ncbi:MAG: SOS response-associated peptidase family protein [Lachnospiraceae bacterium]|nr:SOS response-associated peptidase family protein [Lachnospiraceae bacterium]
MCTRYWVDASPELRPIVEEMRRSSLNGRFEERSGRPFAFGEVRPSDTAPAVATGRRGQKAVFPMKWGFSGKSLLLNARAETAAKKTTFRECFERRRCVLPASCYFEWEHVKDGRGKVKTGSRYRIRPEGERVTWLCGLYRIEEGLPVFVVLTREPGEGISFIHDRMPLILPEECVGEWIRPDADPSALLERALTDMIFEKG